MKHTLTMVPSCLHLAAPTFGIHLRPLKAYELVASEAGLYCQVTGVYSKAALNREYRERVWDQTLHPSLRLHCGYDFMSNCLDRGINLHVEASQAFREYQTRASLVSTYKLSFLTPSPLIYPPLSFPSTFHLSLEK